MSSEKFHIPGDLLRELARKSHKKLIDQDIFGLSESENVVDPICALSVPAGWNQTRNDLKILSEYAILKLLAMVHYDHKKIPAGSGLVVRTGPDLVWIGMILVHPDLRRQGIATRIMIHCLEKLRSGDQPLVAGLDATPEGTPLYQHLGFEDSFEIQRFLVSAKNKTMISGSAEIERITDLRIVEEYATERGFPNSKPYLKILMDLSTGKDCYLIKREDKIAGFVMSRSGRLYPFIGPLMADNEETAALLLNRVLFEWKKKGYSRLFIDIPGMHYKRQDFSVLDEVHVVSKRNFNRMYHLISPDKMNKIKDKPGAGQSGMTAPSLTLMKESAHSYEATRAYMKNERENWMNYFYGIGGPEIG